MTEAPVIGFETLRREDVARVGGKNASLGELIGQLAGSGVRVPPGFATTASVYRRFLQANDLEGMILAAISEFEAGSISLPDAGATIRAAILKGNCPPRMPQPSLRRIKPSAS